VSRVVFDASAIIAASNREGGAQTVLELKDQSAVSTVNLAEVKGKLVQRGLAPGDAWTVALTFSGEIFSFDSEQASIAGGLVALTRPYGLSLGDRACLALALVLDAPVYTADKTWARLDLGLRIHLLR
jgi:PIN domain nuclease of toxin-antitoxin system